MKFLFVIATLLGATLNAQALPVVGEEVVYVGQALMNDGLYDVKKTVRIQAYDPEKRVYTVLSIFEQSAEGEPLGALHELSQVQESYYAAIEQTLIPTLQSKCGESFPSYVPGVLTKSAPEIVETPLGNIAACRMDFPSKKGVQTSSWFSAQTAPWVVKGVDRSLNGTYMTILLQSHTRP